MAQKLVQSYEDPLSSTFKTGSGQLRSAFFSPQILHYLLLVHNFSWVLQLFQEKSTTMVMHNVHYGLGENVKWPRS